MSASEKVRRIPWPGPALIGVVVGAFGSLVCLAWAFQWQWVARVLPGTDSMGLNSPLLFAVTGLLLVFRSTRPAPSERFSVIWWLHIAMVAYPAAILAQSLLSIDLGIDFVRVPTPPTPDSPHPGRISPNASFGFIMAGMALLAARRPFDGGHRRVMTAALVLLGIVSTTALAGYAIGLEQLYRLASYNRILLPTAAALVALAMGLWLLRDELLGEVEQADPVRLRRRILYRGVATLTMVALGAGIVGFATLRGTFEASVMADAGQAARVHALALANTVRTSLWFPSTIVTRPVLIETLQLLERSPEDKAARELLPKVARSFLSADVDGVRFIDAQGQVLAAAGSFPAENSEVVNRLKAPRVQAELRWNKGYVLHVAAPVQGEGRVIGTVITEQRLTLFDEVLAALRDARPSSDALVCSEVGEVAKCAPSRLYGQPFTVPMRDASGKPAFPMSRALMGEAGVLRVKDLRGVPVVAGFTPVGPYGLGLVVKTDVATLYEPLRERFQVAGLLVLGLVAMGTWALLARVQPLVRIVVAEQQRIQTILDTSSDAFIALDVQGNISDWNVQAEQLFGWSRAEALGKPLGEMIVPQQHRTAHAAGFARFVSTGTGPVVNRRTEITALHRDGSEIPVELSISAVSTPGGYVANAFVRDIRERRAAQVQLEASERKLHHVLNSIPAMVGHFDRDERCVFANELALQVHGLRRDQAMGQTLASGISDAAYRLHEPYIRQVLQGQRVRFEGQEVRDGRAFHYQVNLVPERDDGGAVTGFYLMTFDISALKEAKEEVERVAGRLRAITDNMPVMISYIDAQHRLQFLNRTFEEWTGVAIRDALGKTLREALGETLYEQRRAPLEQALRGQRVEFEVISEARGIKRVLQTSYVPDCPSVGVTVGVYTLTSDVTALRTAEQRMAELALTDTLTGLANRRSFEQRLPQALARAARSGTGTALMFLDIDHFKQINDTFGHAAGDAVLTSFAQRLSACTRSTDLVARLAGDEFVVVLEGLHDPAECHVIARKVNDAARAPVLYDGEELTVTTSIGLAYLRAGLKSSDDALLRCADEALYRTKERGRDGYTVTECGAEDAQFVTSSFAGL